MPRLSRLALLLVACLAQPALAGKTQNVVLIVSDGLRWQEVFQGADPLLLDARNGGNWVDEADLKKRYWRDTPQERRRILMPFIWGTVAHEGQIFGNRTQGSDAHVTNGKAFSYPGYNEMSVGYPNPDIDSNAFGPNPNASVFEWLNKSPELSGHVAAYATWAAFTRIFNQQRSHLVIQAGWMTPPKSGDSSKDALLQRLYDTTTRFDEEDVGNSLLQVELLDYVRTAKPRVLFVGYGETDNWAHQGRYDLVLESAQRTDGFIKELWETMQSIPQYHGTTTFIITADHGRGSGPVEWKEHGVKEKGSENVWIAVIGPDTRSLGERTHIEPVTQAQIAATVAALLGKDYRKDVPKAAPPIIDVFKSP
jgi:phosphopentomutase/2,3-bisphosphoglycerate-independent phosphoglycerate mutase family metalloenzyme